MLEDRFQKASFVVFIVLTSIAFICVILPFYGAVLWAIIFAILFDQLQRKISSALHPRKNIAALIAVVVCILIVVVPAIVVLLAVADEVVSIYNWLETHELNLALRLADIRQALPPMVIGAFDFLKLGRLEELQDRLNDMVSQVIRWAAPQALDIGQGAAQMMISLGVMLYILFFLFRDGANLSVTIRDASPLTPAHTDQFLRKFSEVVKATVRGNVLVALIQGGIGGIVFWLLGMESSLLWGAVMAIFSLLPVLGAAAIWFPASCYLLLSGEIAKGAALMAAGVLIISIVDNLLRPSLVGRSTKIPDYVIFVSTLGGIALLGINGFVVGPLVSAAFIAVWSRPSQEMQRSALSEGIDELQRLPAGSKESTKECA